MRREVIVITTHDVPTETSEGRRRLRRVTRVCERVGMIGLGDRGELVFTVLLANED